MEIDWKQKRIREREGWFFFSHWHGLLTLAGAAYFSAGFETETHRGGIGESIWSILCKHNIDAHTKHTWIKWILSCRSTCDMKINPWTCVFVQLFMQFYVCSLMPSPRYQALLFCLRFICYRDNEHSSFRHFFLSVLMWVCIMHTRCARKHIYILF